MTAKQIPLVDLEFETELNLSYAQWFSALFVASLRIHDSEPDAGTRKRLAEIGQYLADKRAADLEYELEKIKEMIEAGAK